LHRKHIKMLPCVRPTPDAAPSPAFSSLPSKFNHDAKQKYKYGGRKEKFGKHNFQFNCTAILVFLSLRFRFFSLSRSILRYKTGKEGWIRYTVRANNQIPTKRFHLKFRSLLLLAPLESLFSSLFQFLGALPSVFLFYHFIFMHSLKSMPNECVCGKSCVISLIEN
jgi:hypothetical protein